MNFPQPGGYFSAKCWSRAKARRHAAFDKTTGLTGSAFKTLADVPEPIDMVDIFRNSAAAGGVVFLRGSPQGQPAPAAAPATGQSQLAALLAGMRGAQQPQLPREFEVFLDRGLDRGDPRFGRTIIIGIARTEA